VDSRVRASCDILQPSTPTPRADAAVWSQGLHTDAQAEAGRRRLAIAEHEERVARARELAAFESHAAQRARAAAAKVAAAEEAAAVSPYGILSFHPTSLATPSCTVQSSAEPVGGT
jgi:hypothetical protein